MSQVSLRLRKIGQGRDNYSPEAACMVRERLKAILDNTDNTIMIDLKDTLILTPEFIHLAFFDWGKRNTSKYIKRIKFKGYADHNRYLISMMRKEALDKYPEPYTRRE